MNKQVIEIVKSYKRRIKTWHSKTHFTDTCGCDGYIFKSEMAAKRSLFSGDNHQNALDYVSGAMRDDQWVACLIAAGIGLRKAKRIISEKRWDEVVQIIVHTCGPEYFLATYSGKIRILNNGSMLYY